MKISINFKVVWDSLSEKSFPLEKDLTVKSCIHSGNAGDIIYSLPTAKELGASHYIINLTSDPAFGGLGGRAITFPMARALAPLLLSQPYIKRVTIVSSNLPLEFLDQPIEGVDFILDRFRLHDPGKHHLAICHALAFGVHLNLYEKWLHVKSTKSDQKYIVLSLTTRYRSLPKEYWSEVLSGLENVVAIGLPQEFDSLAGITADFVTCHDLLEMATLIQGSLLFIGNPGLPYAIAEGLKVPRVVEVFPEYQNAYPIGRSGYTAPPSTLEARNLIDRLIADSPEEVLKHQNSALCQKIAGLEEVVKQKELYVSTLEGELRERETQIGSLEARLRERELHLSTLEETIRSHEGKLRERETQIGSLEARLRERELHLSTLEETIRSHEGELRERETQIGSLEARLREREATLDHIYNSHGWKALLTYYRARDRVLPVETKRRKLMKKVFSILTKK